MRPSSSTATRLHRCRLGSRRGAGPSPE
uniref:Uncharacterized protein n=1 Tax=Arundo donax TaxID=35708 RepID=A0A0A8Z3I5_ARUDO